MYKCIECGHVFEEGEQAEWVEMHGFDYGNGEHWSGCPLCKGSYEKTSQCSICGGEYLKEELNGNVCADCIDAYRSDLDMCFKIGSNSEESIELNSFLTTMFNKDEIEEILLNHLKELSKIEKSDCSKFIDSDIEWFGERLAEEFENEVK